MLKTLVIKLVIVNQHELKRQSNYEIMKVIIYNDREFDVLNLKNKHSYMVTFNKRIGAITCTCPVGTQIIGSYAYQDKECKHVKAVRIAVKQ